MESNSSNCPGLEVLDFRPHYPCFNLTDIKPCEEEWPCELRHYWLELHPFVDITRAFLSYGSVIIIFLGVLLNGLSFYILVSSGLAKNGSGIYLLGLAICDSGNLLANIGLGVWRGASHDFNQFFMESEWLCRLHGVFVEVFQTVSAWIVVAFTVERCLAVWYPMMLRHSRNHRSKVVVASLTAVFSLFCLSKLFLTGFEKDSVFGYMPCNSHRFVWQGMAYVRVAFQTWIPTIIVFVFNCLMFWKLRRIKSNRKKLTAYRRNRGENRDMNGHSRNNSRSFINKPSPTNPMLIAVSLAYLVLVFPLGAVQTIELYWNVHRKVPIATVGDERLSYISWMMTRILIKYIRSFCFGFYQLNFAINFFLYFAAGVEFRVHLQYKFKKLSRLVKTYCCCRSTKVEDRRQHPHNQTHRSNHGSSMSSSAGMSKNPSTKTMVSNLPSLEGIINTGFKNDKDDPQTPNRPQSNQKPFKKASIKFSLDPLQSEESEKYSPVLSNHSETYSPNNQQIPNVSDQKIEEVENDEEEFYDAYEMTDYELDEPGEFVSHKNIPATNSA